MSGFMRGQAAVRRTSRFLESGIVFENDVKAIAFQWNPEDTTKRTHGLGKFVFWHLAQLQFKNPQVHFTTIHKITPSPWIKVYHGDLSESILDCDCRSRDEIHEIMRKAFGPRRVNQVTKGESIYDLNKAGFGEEFSRQCICEAPGQVACPSYTPVPQHLRTKPPKKKRNEEESE